MRVFCLFLFIVVARFACSETTQEVTMLASDVTCIIEKDEYGRILKKEIQDGSQILAKEEISYTGQNFTIIDYAYHQGKVRYKAVSYYEKNKQGQITKRILGVGTDKPQTTFYNFREGGQLSSVMNAKGITISYNYDEEGRLIETSATDHSIDQRNVPKQSGDSNQL
ncbi:MAG: RHS repeat protein [Chlamydiales bacterium]|nr:RHS repeat protein [Chlamydiales bacterium]